MGYEQYIIFFLGLSSIYGVNAKDAQLAKWGPICGLIAQPFWIYTTYLNQQYGILLLSILYLHAWYTGVLRYRNEWSIWLERFK